MKKKLRQKHGAHEGSQTRNKILAKKKRCKEQDL